MIKELVLPHQPRRYLVSNNKHLILVTYDQKVAKTLEENLKAKNYDSNLFPTIHKV